MAHRRGAELKLDHVTLAAASLDEMRRAFTAATGIETEYGGAHSNRATEMALASFPDGSYLELIAIRKNADQAAVDSHVWSRFLRGNAGLCAFAIRAPDIEAEVRRLANAGLRVGATEKSGRTRPDGVLLSWETADAGPPPRGSVLPFLIRDLTARNCRVYPSGRPTTARFGGVGVAVIGVRDLRQSTSLYRKAFDLPEPDRQRDDAFGADLAWFEGTPVALASAVTDGSWLARRIERFGEAGCAFILDGEPGNASATRWFGKRLEWFDAGKSASRIGVWR